MGSQEFKARRSQLYVISTMNQFITRKEVKMKSLVSGASGFISSHLSERLAELGHSVQPISRDLLANRESLEDFIWDERPDYIFHLASYGNHSHQDDPLETWEANVVKTLNLFKASRHAKLKGLINFSTSAIALPTQTNYSLTKKVGEEVGKMFSDLYNLPLVTIRPYSIYGPGEANFRFIPKISTQIRRGEKITISPGSHDWVYVSDFVAACIIVAEKAKRLKGKVINVGTGKQWANWEIADKLEEIAGYKVDREMGIPKPYDAPNWVADPTEILRLGWKPKISLEQGLKVTYASY